MFKATRKCMNPEEIRKLCLALPDVKEKLQWGDALCFKIREKMFAVLGLDQVRLTFKTTPEMFVELTEQEDITPAPYLGHYNWVMLHRLDALPATRTKELIRASYAMVLEKAPKKRTATKRKLPKPARKSLKSKAKRQKKG
jgi:predicted DNA-binding protein (MmcQ/YjbR family)